MKTKQFLLCLILIFSIAGAHGYKYVFPAHECVRLAGGGFDPDSMSFPSRDVACRPGQRLLNATIAYNDISLEMCCCDWLTTPTEQIRRIEQYFVAFNCKFKSGAAAPRRSSLVVSGDDLMCFKGEKLQHFDIEFDDITVSGSCCFIIPTTSTSTTTTTTARPLVTTVGVVDTTPAPTEVTTCSATPTFLHTTTSAPRRTFKLQAAASTLPSTTVASECLYASAAATEPIRGYMSYDDPYFTLACRSSLQQQMVTLETVNDDIMYTIYCCKVNKSLPIPSTTEKIIAHECEYENDDGVTLLSYSGVTPGNDLVCDSENHVLVTLETTHAVTNKKIKVSCCQPHEFTTTTEEPEVTTTTTPKPTTTTMRPTTTLLTTAKTTPFPTYPKARGKAGLGCVYLGDGSLKVNYMDYCDDQLQCRSQQYVKKLRDKAGYDRCCCQFSKSMKPDYSITGLVAPQCDFKEDTSFSRWAIIKTGKDLVCEENFRIVSTVIRENDKDVSMSCCLRNDKNVPTTTTSTTTTTTPRPRTTTGKAGVTVTTAKPTTTAPQVAKAGVQCSYNDDKTLKTSFMDDCSDNMLCRSKERLLSAYVTMSDLSQVKKCCCDFQANLPPSSDTPPVIAPKCVYNDAGYISSWSVITAGDDLGCMTSDNLLTFNMANGKVADQQMSCCIKKTATTVLTTMRTTPLPTTTVRTTPPPKPQKAALECFYTNLGKLNYNYMDWWGSELVCRDQFRMKIERVTTSQGNLAPKCCCELDKTLPPTDDVGTIIAPTCYYAEGTGTLSRWSVLLHGPDLTCSEDSYLVNTTIFNNAVEKVYSCCQPKDQEIPTTAAPKPQEQVTADPTSEIIYFALPMCEYRSNGTLRTTFMEYCSFDLVCRSQELMVNTTTKNRSGQKVTKCCCDSHPELPPQIPPYPVRAQKCYFNEHGYIAQWSVVPFGPDLICSVKDNLITYLLEFDAQEKNMSCCLDKEQTTLPTTARPRSSTTTTTAPMTTTMRTTVQPTTTTLETTTQAATKSDIATSTPLTTSTTTITRTTSSTEETTTTHVHLGGGEVLAGAATTQQPATTTQPTTIPMSRTGSISDVSTTAVMTTTKAPPIVTTTKAPTVVVTVTTKAVDLTTTVADVTTTIATTKTPFKGRRTAPPKKSEPPPRTPKTGECPDCIYSDDAMLTGITIVIDHLKRAGPAVGKCPSGYTMRIVYAMPLLGYRDNKCCCECDQHPLPYKLA